MEFQQYRNNMKSDYENMPISMPKSENSLSEHSPKSEKVTLLTDVWDDIVFDMLPFVSFDVRRSTSKRRANVAHCHHRDTISIDANAIVYFN